MCKLRIETLGEGMHPSELWIKIKTINGKSEQLIVDRQIIREGMLEIGHPIGSDGDSVLIELPRETTRGEWRIWVPSSELEKAYA